MTKAELQAEHLYRLTERLGHLCGSDNPTPEQLAVATSEADWVIEQLTQEGDGSTIAHHEPQTRQVFQGEA